MEDLTKSNTNDTSLKESNENSSEEKGLLKGYVAEYVIDAKDSTIEATLEDGRKYFKFLLKYLNKQQTDFKIESLLDCKLVDSQIHIYVKMLSSFHDINLFFEYLNTKCSMAYVEVMTDDDYKLWGDIIRLYQFRFWKDFDDQPKIKDEELQDDDGWIPLEKLKEGLEKKHIIEHPEIKTLTSDGSSNKAPEENSKRNSIVNSDVNSDDS